MMGMGVLEDLAMGRARFGLVAALALAGVAREASAEPVSAEPALAAAVSAALAAAATVPDARMEGLAIDRKSVV